MDRQLIIERERNWAAPAATAAILAFILYLVSFAIDRSANLYTGASDARQLASIHDHASTVLIGSLFRAATFLLVPLPFLYLFRAAQARNPRVQAVMLGFVFIGPLLFAAQGVVQAKGASNAASDFVKLPPEQAKPYSAFQHQVKSDSGSIDKVTIYTAPNPDQIEVQRTDGSFYKVERVPANAANSLSATLDSVDHETDSDSGALPGDALARHLTDNSNAIQVAQG